MIEEKIRTAKATRPSMRWRNRWYVAVRYQNCYNGEWVGPGEYWGAFVWPSREVAEQIGKEDLARFVSSRNVRNNRYLGALPVNE